MSNMFKKKITNTKEQTAQDFVNVEDISENILYSKDGYLFGYLRVSASDNKLMRTHEQDLLASDTAATLGTEQEPWQLLSIPRTIDTLGMIADLNELRKNTYEDARLKLINGEIGALQAMTREGLKEPYIVLKCWVKAKRGGDIELLDRLNSLRSSLMENRISAEILTEQEIVYLCKIFADLTTYQDDDEYVYNQDIPILEGKQRKFSVEQVKRETLLNLITPIGGMSFGQNTSTVGSVVGRIYGATCFPQEGMNYGWAVDLMNSSNCITCITYRPGSPNELGDALSQSIKRNESNAIAESDPRSKMKYERQAEDAKKSINNMDANNDVHGHITLLVMPFTEDEQKLEDVCRSVVKRFKKKNIKLRTVSMLQRDAFKQLSPYYTTVVKVDGIYKQLFPLETLTGGFPMVINNYRDSRGCYFARTIDGNVMSIDFLHRGGDRTNGNIVITGMAGRGKSTALKSILQSLYMIGVKIVIIDPEREYRDLCKNLNGTWLDAGGGNAIINPLQIRPVAMDDEDELEENRLYQANDNAMALHIHTLEVFWKLRLPSLTDVQLALLKKTLVDVYRNNGIDWNTDIKQVSAEQFPILSDLYQALQQASKKDSRYQDIATLFYDLGEGADSFLWNGHTNINTDNNFVCLDTNRLQNSSDEMKRAQYFNLLTLGWQIASEDRTQPVCLVYEEAHTILDPAIPETAMILRNESKRIRKYEGMMVTVMQSVVDALHPKIALYGQALLDNAVYKLLFGTDGKNLKETADVFNLTEAEQNILLSGQRGKALCLIGNSHVHVDFQIPKYKLDLMGKGGGR